MIVYSMRLWLRGVQDVVWQLLRRDQRPSGQRGGFLSPLLETLRVGHAARWVEGKYMLDCGCGRGRLLEMLGSGVCYTGVDNNPALVNYLQKRFPQSQFVCASVEELTFPKLVTFDCIVMTALLEHLVSPAEVLEHIVALLRPDGVLVITTPTPAYEILLHMGSRLGLFDRHADKDHKQLLTRADLEDALEGTGLQLERYYCFAFGGNQLAVGRKPADALT